MSYLLTLTLSSQNIILQQSSRPLTQWMRTRPSNPNSNAALLALIHSHSFSVTLTHSTYYISSSTYYYHWLAKARSYPCSVVTLVPGRKNTKTVKYLQQPICSPISSPICCYSCNCVRPGSTLPGSGCRHPTGYVTS